MKKMFALPAQGDLPEDQNDVHPDGSEDVEEQDSASSDEDEGDLVQDDEEDEGDDDQDESEDSDESDGEADDEDESDEDSEDDDSGEEGDGQDESKSDGESDEDKPNPDEKPATDESSSEPPLTVPAVVSESDIDANPLQFFKPEYVPGTGEYIDRLTTAATKEACKRLGIKEDEYDPYNTKHVAAFNFSFNRLDSSESNRFNEAKKSVAEDSAKAHKAAKVNIAKGKASAEIDKILTNKDLQDKYLALLENSPHKKVREGISAASERGDFSFFIETAKTAAGVKANLKKVQDQAKPATPTKQNKGKTSGDSRRKPVGSDVLGF